MLFTSVAQVGKVRLVFKQKCYSYTRQVFCYAKSAKRSVIPTASKCFYCAYREALRLHFTCLSSHLLSVPSPLHLPGVPSTSLVQAYGLARVLQQVLCGLRVYFVFVPKWQELILGKEYKCTSRVYLPMTKK